MLTYVKKLELVYNVRFSEAWTEDKALEMPASSFRSEASLKTSIRYIPALKTSCTNMLKYVTLSGSWASKEVDAMTWVPLIWMIAPYLYPASKTQRYSSCLQKAISTIPPFSLFPSKSFLGSKALAKAISQDTWAHKLARGSWWKQIGLLPCVPQPHSRKYGYLNVVGCYLLPAVSHCRGYLHILCK